MDKNELTKLVKLRIREISGVGEEHGSGPASGLEGWMVTKARGDTRKIIATADADAVFEAIEKARHEHRGDGGKYAPRPTSDLGPEELPAEQTVFPMSVAGGSAPMLPHVARAMARASGKKHPHDDGPSDHLGIYGDPSNPGG